MDNNVYIIMLDIDEDKLATKVSEMMEIGYQPFGSVFVTITGNICQPMINMSQIIDNMGM